MNRKYVSMLILVAIIFISLSLSGYSFLVNKHAAAIPMIYSEGMDNQDSKPATKPNTTLPVDPATQVGGLSSSAYSPPVSANTSGQKNATKQALNQQSNQAEADQTTAMN